MEKQKKTALVQFLAGVLVPLSGLNNLGLLDGGTVQTLGLIEGLAIVQIITGPVFIYLGYKTWKSIESSNKDI